MENGNNDIKIYSAADITRYWEGKMSSQEMHALEAAAMEDQFLADALDGYAAMKSNTAAADLDELHERLIDRQQNEKIVRIKSAKNWLKIAAIFICIIGGTLATYLLVQQKSTNQLSKAEKNVAPALRADSITSTERSTFMPMPDSTKLNTFKEPEVSNNDRYISHFSTKAPADVKQNDVAVNVPDLSQYRKDSLKDKADSVLMASSASGAAANRLEDLARSQRAAPNPQVNNVDKFVLNSFNGRVVDAQNNAIPYASVKLNNSNQATTTNNDGYFQLKSPDTVLNVSIASLGYEPRNLTIRGNEQVQNVMLEPSRDAKLQEVVITASKDARKMAPSAKESAKKTSEKPSNLNVYVMDAQPVNGWEEFNGYLQENKRPNADDKNSKGEVVISFWVNKKGKLSDFTIEKSMGKALDEEAIRLIKEGPDWKLLKGKKTRARVIVPF